MSAAEKHRLMFEQNEQTLADTTQERLNKKRTFAEAATMNDFSNEEKPSAVRRKYNESWTDQGFMENVVKRKSKLELEKEALEKARAA